MKKKKLNEGGRGWFYVPALAYFSVFMLVPLLGVIALTFTSLAGFDIGQAHFAGLHNYRQIGNDSLFNAALLRTLIFVAVTTVGLNAIGLGFALVINSRVRGHGLLRVAVLVPLAVSPVIAGVVWQMLLGPLGLLEHVLADLGVSQPVNFLGQNYAFPSILVVSLWQYAGYDTLIYFAGLQSLPLERVEAARVDGAKPAAVLRHVIWPFLRPVAAVAIAINLIGGWKVFDIVYVLTGGGPADSSQVLSTDLYQQAFTFDNLAYASTIGLVIIGLAVASVLGQRRIARTA